MMHAPTPPLFYEVDGPTYLGRQARIRRLLEQFNEKRVVRVADWAAEMTAVHAEVPPLPLVAGARYRVRLFGGKPAAVHRHYRDMDTGEVHGIDIPQVSDVESTEIEGVFVRRPASAYPPDSGVLGSIVLEVAGRLAIFGDVDVLRLEEIR